MKKIIPTLIIFLSLSMYLTACSLLTDLQELDSESSEAESDVIADQEEVGGEAVLDEANPAENVGGEAETVAAVTGNYSVVATGQQYCYSDVGTIPCPAEGENFFGQDAQYPGNTPQYVDNGDGTVSDLVTGLMWQQDPGAKMTYEAARNGAAGFNLAGHSDWRLPSIKEFYSLIQFSGIDPAACPTADNCPDLLPFINADIFIFNYGNVDANERLIDAQYLSSTEYVVQTVGPKLVFGVNFADGRIKGYPAGPGGPDEKQFFARYVRDNPEYGKNQFLDNADGTITDQSTGLMWMQSDSLTGYYWGEALAYCENLDWAGYSDWRLPAAKELHSIVDYARSPDTTNSAAIASIFSSSSLANEAGNPDFPFYWSSTSLVNRVNGGVAAVYLSFGRAMGYLQDQWQDVHGAGAQRADPKSGDPADFPTGRGPQGDAVRIKNYARCVREGVMGAVVVGGNTDPLILSPGDLPTSEEIQDQLPAEGEQPQLPPNEAVEACSDLAAGAECSFNGPTGTVNGTCRDLMGQLACAPNLGLPGLP